MLRQRSPSRFYRIVLNTIPVTAFSAGARVDVDGGG